MIVPQETDSFLTELYFACFFLQLRSPSSLETAKLTRTDPPSLKIQQLSVRKKDSSSPTVTNPKEIEGDGRPTLTQSAAASVARFAARRNI
jgi:hypothetical protein